MINYHAFMNNEFVKCELHGVKIFMERFPLYESAKDLLRSLELKANDLGYNRANDCNKRDYRKYQN